MRELVMLVGAGWMAVTVEAVMVGEGTAAAPPREGGAPAHRVTDT